MVRQRYLPRGTQPIPDGRYLVILFDIFSRAEQDDQVQYDVFKFIVHGGLYDGRRLWFRRYLSHHNQDLVRFTRRMYEELRRAVVREAGESVLHLQGRQLFVDVRNEFSTALQRNVVLIEAFHPEEPD